VRSAILVPAPDYPEDWDWAYEVEAAVLLRAGFSVEARPWNEAGDLSEFDLVMPLVAWGYHNDPGHWHALLDRLEGEGVSVINPVPLLRWNSNKRYLAELGEKGVSTIPTWLVEELTEDALGEARFRFGDEIVIKPPVSASAYGTYRLGRDDPVPPAALGQAMLVQPFLRSVAAEGEYSVMLFGGRFSHCIVKRPKSGDYRVQPHLGGTEQPCAPPDGAIELAEAALAAAPAAAAYGRVDMMRNNEGELAVVELELIEPALWLQHAPDGGQSFVDAIKEALT
jgi:glutathione synthase/RimK-type ligase-like ATP-grasp enzyme